MNDAIVKYREYINANKSELTVFMTVHNRERYIREAIDSVLNNTLKNFCFIFLDNCSTDKTPDIIKEYESKLNNIIYIHRESTLDYSNFQYAVDVCETDYFLVLHDDDIVYPNILSRLLHVIKESDCVAVSPISQYIDENSNDIYTDNKVKESIQFKNDEYLLNYLKKDRVTMCYPATIYRKNFFVDKSNYFTLKCGPCFDDYFYFQICRLGGAIEIIPEKLIKYRIHSGQMSNYAKIYMYLELYNYMMDDEYYLKILENNSSRIQHDLWTCYKRLFKAYNYGKIEKDKLKSFFSIKCFDIAKKTLLGKLLYLLTTTIYKHNNLAFKTLRLFKKI